MIYVLKSPMYLEDTKRHCFAIKVGFTVDFEKRIDQYRLHNPAIRIIKTYEGGTLEDEYKIKKYLKDYNIFRNEWFKYCPYVLNLFNMCNSVEDLKRITGFVNLSSERNFDKSKFYNYALSVKNIIGNHIILSELQANMMSMCIPKDDSVLSFICDRYPEYASSIIQDYLDMKEYLITSGLIDFINRLKYSKTEKLCDRLKLLCETQEFTEDEKRIIAQQTSEKFDKYYNLLGPERCKAHGYSTDKINREIQDKLMSVDKIKEEFYKEFQVGGKYSNIEAKNHVKELYLRIGLNRSPKAKDIGEYFNIKTSKVKLDDGSWVHGIEILSIK